MKADGQVPDLPDCPLPWMVEALMELGPVIGTGTGAVAIGWRDIAAWAECTGTRPPPWQARLLRRLSLDWLVMARDAEKPDCPPPWQSAEAIEANRSAVDRKVERMFELMSRGTGR